MIDAFRKDKRELDIREHEVKLLEEQVGGSNATKVSCLIRPGSIEADSRSSPRSKQLDGR
jgi:hypothetical protein